MSVALMAARGTHDRPGGWTPKNLGTLSLWLDADDATTITIATGVSQWDDKSGNGRHVTQTTGSAQPSWQRVIQSGRAVVRFDGSDDFLTGGDVLDMLSGGLSMMVAVKPDGGSIVTKYGYGPPRNGDYNLTRQGMQSFPGDLQNIARDTSYTASEWIAVGAVIDRTTNVVAYRNGSSVATNATGLPNTTSWDSANPFWIGDRNVSTNPLNGDIGEVVLSLATWTTTERQQVEGYLAHKWGLAGSLPNDHPWKDKAP